MRVMAALGGAGGILAAPDDAEGLPLDQHLAANLANLFRTQRFRTYTTDDIGVLSSGDAWIAQQLAFGASVAGAP